MNRRFRGALASAATIAVLVVGALAPSAAIAASASSAATEPEYDPSTPYFLINVATGLAADLPAGSTDSQATLRQATASWDSNKAWYVRPTGNTGFALTTDLDRLALERLPADGRGILVGQRSFTGKTNQQWTLTRTVVGQVAVRAADTGQALQVGAVSGDPAAVTVGPDNGKQTQRWRLVAKYPVSLRTTSSPVANSIGWNTTPVDVMFSMSYPESTWPTPTIQTRVQGTTAWSNASLWAPVRVTAQGSTVLEYRALRSGYTAAGSSGSTVIRIDSVAPTAWAVMTPASGTVAAGGTVSATLVASDLTSSVDRTEYSTDGGTTWVRGEVVSFTDVGAHAVAYRAVDRAGNIGATRTLTLTVQAPPSAAATVTSADTEPTADGWYQNDASVTLVAPAAGQKIQYRPYGSDWKNYTGPVKVARNGVSTLDHRLVTGGQPAAGSQASLTVKLDKVVPTATATRTPSSGNGTPRKPVSLSFVAKDLHSGVSKVEYRVNAGAWVTASAAPVVFDKVGSYTVEYRVTDVAGNVSAVRSVPVTITTK